MLALWVRRPGDSAFAKTATDSSPSSNGSFSYAFAAGQGAYAFYTLAVDGAGNAESAPGSADLSVTYDTVSPTGADIQTTSAGNAGQLGTGDAITFTFSEPIDPASVLAGWTGGAQAVTLAVAGTSNSNSVLTVTAGGLLPLTGASGVQLNGKYVGATVTFNATMTLSGDRKTVTVTAGSQASGATNDVKKETKEAAMAWATSAAIRDLAGNPLVAGTITESGTPADVEF